MQTGQQLWSYISLGKTGDLMNIFSPRLIFGSTGMMIEPLVLKKKSVLGS